MKLQAKAHQMYTGTKLLLNFVDYIIENIELTLKESIVTEMNTHRCVQLEKRGYFLSNNLNHNLNFLRKNEMHLQTSGVKNIEHLRALRLKVIFLNTMLKCARDLANAHKCKMTDTFLSQVVSHINTLIHISELLEPLLKIDTFKFLQKIILRIKIQANEGYTPIGSYQLLVQNFNTLKQEMAESIKPSVFQAPSELTFVKDFLDSANTFCQKNPNLSITFGMHHVSAHKVTTTIIEGNNADVEFVIAKTVDMLKYDQKYQNEQKAKKLAEAQAAIQKVMKEHSLTEDQLIQLVTTCN